MFKRAFKTIQYIYKNYHISIYAYGRFLARQHIYLAQACIHMLLYTLC